LSQLRTDPFIGIEAQHPFKFGLRVGPVAVASFHIHLAPEDPCAQRFGDAGCVVRALVVHDQDL